MKSALLLLSFFFVGISIAQKTKSENMGLTNVIIVGQMDHPSERYSVEINLSELFASSGIKTMASLNLIKLGSDSQILASDSIAKMSKEKGFDTFMLISVRGYDKRFKTTDSKTDMATELGRANLFQIYQMDIVSVSFEVKFFREGQQVHKEVIKIGGAGSRDKVLSKLRKKVGKRIEKSWSK